MYLFPEDALEQFGFNKIKTSIQNNCISAPAKLLAQNIVPIDDKPSLLLSLNQTNEYYGIILSASYFPLFQFHDIGKSLDLLRVKNAILSVTQFLEIKLNTESANSIIRFLNEKKDIYETLYLLVNEQIASTEIIKLIDKIIDATGEVRSTASTRLGQIRKDLSLKRREFEKLFSQQISKYRKLGFLAETEETVHNGHKVLAILSEHKRSVKGIVVGSSESGKTTYMEPLETLEVFNEVFELEAEERREIEFLLKNLGNELRPSFDIIKNHFALLVNLDFIRAKAQYAKEINASLPEITDTPQIKLFKAYHPILLQQNKLSQKETVPLYITLDPQTRILIISGPNAGGKSIAMKTVGLLQLMLQSGLLISADERSKMGLFKSFLCDIGDSQSIENELSTYSSRLLKMRKFSEWADSKSLILIDEFGSGSDPGLGGCIAEALFEDIHRKKAIGIFTTHYLNIKTAASRFSGAENGCMLFDEEHLKPLYILHTGQPGSSYTFLVAEKIGLQKHLIKSAKDKANVENLKLDNLLVQLQRDKSKTAQKLQELDTNNAKAQEARTKYMELFERYVGVMEKFKANRESELHLLELGRKFKSFMNDLEHTKNKKEIFQRILKTTEKESIRRTDKQSSEKSKQELSPEEFAHFASHLVVGAEVRIFNAVQTGIIDEIKKDKAIIIYGNVKTTVNLSKLIPIHAPEFIKQAPKKTNKPQNRKPNKPNKPKQE